MPSRNNSRNAAAATAAAIAAKEKEAQAVTTTAQPTATTAQPTATTAQPVAVATAATVALNQPTSAKKDKPAIFAKARDCFAFVDVADVPNAVDVTFAAKSLRVFLHESKDGFHADFNNNAACATDANLSALDSPQADRVTAIKYAVRNGLYQSATRDLREARASVATVKQENQALRAKTDLESAKNAVLMFALGVPNAELTAAQLQTVSAAEPEFIAVLPEAARALIDTFAASVAASVAPSAETAPSA